MWRKAKDKFCMYLSNFSFLYLVKWWIIGSQELKLTCISGITPTIVILFFSQWHYPSRMTWNSEVSRQMSLSSQIDIKKLIEFIIWSLGPPSELHCSRVYSFKIHFKQSLLFGSPAHKMIESTNQQLFY